MFPMRQCRACESTNVFEVLSLGKMPLANGFTRSINDIEENYDLTLVKCDDCHLAQLSTLAPPLEMFEDYLYVPSTSKMMLAHFDSLAAFVIERFKLSQNDLVIDIGSNDGTLLEKFGNHGMRLLGIDPAKNLADRAKEKGVDTVSAFFSAKLGNELRMQGVRPKIITATNVLAHAHDLHDFCDGLVELMTDETVFIAEFPYLPKLIESTEFDTIYHEHVYYFLLTPLVRIFKEHGLSLVNVEQVPTHGGSLRIFVKRGVHLSEESVVELLRVESQKWFGREPYSAFSKRVQANIEKLAEYLNVLKKSGKRIVAYGASAKGSILLNAMGLSPGTIEYVVDSITEKQGRFTPGQRLEIFPESKILEASPDYLLLLAWNFKEEILDKNKSFREAGGKFIVPVPELSIL
jgi:hypothetical protein